MAEYELFESETTIMIRGPEEAIFLDDDCDPGTPRLCRITLELRYKFKEKYWDFSVIPGELLLSKEESKDLPDFCVDFEIFGTEANKAKAYRKIAQTLRDALTTECGIPDDDSEDIAGSFIEQFKEKLESISEFATKIGAMTFLVDLESAYYYHRVLSELSNDDDDYNSMIPTNYATIKSLERKRPEDYAETIEDRCTICLEDMDRNSEVCSLPCSHVFHGDCIIEWLNTSHYCPICRFEMPARKPDEVCSTD